MNIIYAETFFNDVLLNNQYSDSAYRNEQNPTYIKTLGFYTAGDGGAAVYKAVSTDVNTTKVITKDNRTYRFAEGYFWLSNNALAFQLVPQNDKVIAEQIGILPDDTDFAIFNRRLIDLGFYYATQNSCRFEFSAGKTYYITPYSIAIRSNMIVEGNNAQIVVVNYDIGKQGIFCCETPQHSIIIRNLNIKGRIVKIQKKVKDEVTNEEITVEVDGNIDSAFHCCGSNFVLRNVNVDWFGYAIQSYSQKYQSNEDFVVPEIVNQNWLIDNCIINNTGMGLQISEVDGIIIKNSRIYSQLSGGDGEHNLYLSSNCSNIRVNNTTLGHANGGAIHKHYPPGAKSVKFTDQSRNQFYTDIVMHDAETCMMLGLISENVISDSIFATQINRLLNLSSSWNCIISNCNLSQTRHKTIDDPSAFVSTGHASHFWMQNSDVYYGGSHRVSGGMKKDSYYKRMCEEYPNSRRHFIGANRDIAGFLLKFTGCNIESSKDDDWCYFALFGTYTDGNTISGTAYQEYWDNCFWKVNAYAHNIYRLQCVNKLHSGITMRNSYLKDVATPGKSPFRFWCSNTSGSLCFLCSEQGTCSVDVSGHFFPWIRLENSIFDSFIRTSQKGWGSVVQVNSLYERYSTVKEAINVSNSYVSNCYNFANNKFNKFDNLMAV